MADSNKTFEIPEGWILHTRVDEDGREVKGFYCPETEQEFPTYEMLMRYVRYAKDAQLSIYALDSEFMKRKNAASSKSSITERGEKCADPEGSTASIQKPNPKPKPKSRGKSSASKAIKKRQQPKRK